MRSYAIAAIAAAGVVSATPTATTNELPKRASLPVVSASGNAFYADGKRFFLRGIDYQPGGSSANEDPIADPKICKRDIAMFKELGINAVRIYSVDNSVDHTECMSALADAGIYLVADVNNPDFSINRAKPGPSYNAMYLQSVFAVIDEFQQYDNTLAFFSGNEVINDETSVGSAPYVKAVTRDMRNYIKARGYRQIPVGYSAADVETLREQTADYFNCGVDEERSDFFAFNDYSWCAPNTFDGTDWPQKVKTFSNYGIPLFLSEWGCIKNDRTFIELSGIMSEKMSPAYSGGLLYEYSEEEEPDYGIVKINGNSVTKKPGFDLFKAALKKYQAPTGTAGAKTASSSQDCPAVDDVWKMGKWGASALPAMPSDAQKYFTASDGAGKGPGLGPPGSQEAGTDNHPTATPGHGSGDVPTDGSGGSGDDEGAGARPAPPMDTSVFFIAGVVSVFSLVGTMLL